MYPRTCPAASPRSRLPSRVHLRVRSRNGRLAAETDMQRFLEVTPPIVHNIIGEMERRGPRGRIPPTRSQHCGHDPGGQMSHAPTDQCVCEAVCRGASGSAPAARPRKTFVSDRRRGAQTVCKWRDRFVARRLSGPTEALDLGRTVSTVELLQCFECLYGDRLRTEIAIDRPLTLDGGLVQIEPKRELAILSVEPDPALV